MNIARRLVFPPLTRAYSAKYPRPSPGTSERPAYHAPDPLINNPGATVTTLTDEDLTFIHRPPPTAPTPFSTTLSPASPLLRPAPPPLDGPLPPYIRPSAYKPAPPRLPDHIVAEIKRLRLSDPVKWTRGKIAKKFGCTQTFVGMIAAVKKPQRKQLVKAHDAIAAAAREKWSERHSIVRAIREKRRALW